MMPSDEKLWRIVYNKIIALDKNWDKIRFRTANLQELKDFLQMQCAGEEHLAKLSRMITPKITQKILSDMLVPVERNLSRLKITDVEILTDDLPVSSAEKRTMPLTFVVDSLRSAMNVGAIFRIADCFGVNDIILSGYSPTPENERVKAAAMGTEKYVKFQKADSGKETIDELRAKGVFCVAMETVENAIPLEDFDWKFPAAVFFGNERFGLEADLIVKCDATVKIPVFGYKNSLNVATACSIVAYNARTKWEKIS